MIMESERKKMFGLNKKTRRMLSIAIIFLLMIIISAFHISINLNTIFFLFYLSIFILGIGFEDEMSKIILSILYMVVILTLIGIVFLWLFKIPTPFIPLQLTDQSIVAIFTIVLASATIWSVFIYQKSTLLSRLSVLDVRINQDLSIYVKNVGSYPIKRLEVEMELKELLPLRERGKKFLKRLKDSTLNVQEKEIHYLSLNEQKNIDFTEYIKKRFSLSENRNDRDEFLGFVTNKGESKRFRVAVRVKYQSDQLFKSPFPIVRNAIVDVNDKESIVETD